jgi:hypothetical protein
MKRNCLLFFLGLNLLVAGLSGRLGAEPRQKARQAQEQQQPQLHEEVTVRWWLVPVYAVDKTGAPVLNLAPEDLEVYIKGLRVEPFSLIKKQFQVTQTGKREAAAPKPVAPAQKKMVFLVFDAAFSPYNQLAKAKAIADTVIAQSDKSAQYVLMSIEPFAGLNYITGPTRDLNLLARCMKVFVAGKKQDYLLQASEMDRGEIHNARPGGGRSPFSRLGGARKSIIGGSDVEARNLWRDYRRVAGSYTSALMTLNLVLGYFKEYSKVVYLYSCGIPSDAFLDRTETPTKPARPGEPESQVSEVELTFDAVSYDRLKTIGKLLNKSGALLFLVNPSGTWISESDKDSGEQSLRMLATESGGRYFEGAEKQISQEVNNMEGGYYEISFPDKPEYEGQELSFEIRSVKPDIQIFTVRRVGREKTFADMSELEKEVLVLNILNKGPYTENAQAVAYVEGQALQEGGSLVCRIPLPGELAHGEWSVFKVWRNFDTGQIQMEKEQILAESPACEVRMKWRGKAYRHDIVLAHVKTGTILVWK